jgi:hypothetical protein
MMICVGAAIVKGFVRQRTVLRLQNACFGCHSSTLGEMDDGRAAFQVWTWRKVLTRFLSQNSRLHNVQSISAPTTNPHNRWRLVAHDRHFSK